MERLTSSAAYDQLRAFLENEAPPERRLTPEWLAGRLFLPLGDCTAALDRLTHEGLLRRHERADASIWFAPVPPGRATGLRRVLLGLVVVAVSVGIVATGAMMRHVFFFALGLGLGLMIAFAWLDWELRARG